MQGYPIVKVKDIRHMERNKSDLLKLIPATVFAITPFTIYFFPLLIRYVPGFFPSPYWTQGMLEKRDQILAESRKEITPLIKQDIVRIRDALSSTSEKSGSFHVRLINQTVRNHSPVSLLFLIRILISSFVSCHVRPLLSPIPHSSLFSQFFDLI
ncbi:hypothetical protein BKA69DRAFT_1089378 [Paraphysoderma sedebokerense]|nr:hypothetical protein BKA69DRAFT_1089378 [Paraphysoderma sedebokerense]